MRSIHPGRLRLAGLLLLVVGCAPPGTPAPNPARHLHRRRVAAASDLQAAFPALAARARQAAGIEVEFVAGASGLFAQQIRQGAPFDVFLSADRAFVQSLADAGAIRPDSVRPYAIGSLVLVIHRDVTAPVASLADLTRPEIAKIAIANPDTAPYGRAARQALERAGLWKQVEPKVVPAESVRQALQFVQTGNAEAGLVGRAIADVPQVRWVPVAGKLHDPIVQTLGIVAGSPHAEAAGRFTAFLLGPEGSGILSKFGFAVPETAP